MSKKKQENRDMLIDVQPENTKEIAKAARLYKEHQANRIAAFDKEVEAKQKLLQLVKEANLQPLEGGVIKFTCDGLTISVKPRDELITVKEQANKE
jgi:hypothetical protein